MRNLPKSDHNTMIFPSLGKNEVRNLVPNEQGLTIRTFAIDPALVPAGVAVSIRPQEKKKAILVNPAEAHKEGSRFGARLLKICEIYEGSS